MNVAQMNILLKTRLNLNDTILQDLKAIQRKSNFVGDKILGHYMKHFHLLEASDLQKRKWKAFTVLHHLMLLFHIHPTECYHRSKQ